MLGYDKDSEKLDKVYRVFYIVLVFFIIKIINIQIVNHSYYLELSEKNRIRTVAKLGPRGNIISSDGEVLAKNKISYSVMYFPREKMDEEYIKNLSKQISKISSTEYNAVLKSIEKIQKGLKPAKIVDGLSVKTAMYLYEVKNVFPEIEIMEENIRYYPMNNMLSHIIGYTAKMDENDWKYYSAKGYSFDALVGKTGVEKKYEEYLKGKNGGLFMEVDNRGRLVRIMGFEKWEKGNDVKLTIDYSVQKAAEEALNKLPYKRGAAVCLDSNTGKVLAYAVKPGYDLNYFSSYREDKKNENIDEFNIPISGLYPPASTFKIITTIAAVESGKIKEDTKFYCPGFYDAGNRVFKCWEKKGHKEQNLIDALANSCDVYYYNVGYIIGPYEIENVARKFRLNEKTGIDLPYEKPGKIFGPKSRMDSKGYWFVGDTLNMAIGQGETLVTPIGMAMVMMALSNGGIFYKPYYVDSIIKSDGKVLLKNEKEFAGRIELKEETYNIIKKAMRRVVTDGTGKICDIKGIDVYGKTGTAQNPHGKDHAWFVAFAEKEGKNPIAVSVLVEHGEHGSSAAAPVARDIIKAYYKTNSDKNESVNEKMIIE
ncbi:MAG TPA: penicillin-binding protein 2 [Elusimicrobiales bacterium]|nr:penicillin-binding protein 2 [Elusimicrobiales bacterium]HOL61928.1 penicillin-binding protein 2 [Elusimicrobiales bacterium]